MIKRQNKLIRSFLFLSIFSFGIFFVACYPSSAERCLGCTFEDGCSAESGLHTATSKVFKTFYEEGKEPDDVILYDLDSSGYLEGPCMIVEVSPYSRFFTYPEQKWRPLNEFTYAPTPWAINNSSLVELDRNTIPIEGIKYDQTAVYHYITTMRKYFEDYFGFKQDETLLVWMFDERTDPSDYTNLPVGRYRRDNINGVNVPLITFGPSLYASPGYLQYPFNSCREYSLMHEYAHYVFMHYFYDDNYPDSSQTETAGINETWARFWPSTVMDEPVHGKTFFPENIPPFDFRQDVYYVPGSDFLNLQDSLGTALWDLRDHPRIGKINAEKMIWEAMARLPSLMRDPIFGDVTDKCIESIGTLTQSVGTNPATGEEILVKDVLLENYVTSIFAKHGISRIVCITGLGDIIEMEERKVNFIENEAASIIHPTIGANEETEVTITFVNKSPATYEGGSLPKLIRAAVAINPNIDNAEKQNVVMTYPWTTQESISSDLTKINPGDTFAFRFNITAPEEPGVYAFDWAIFQDNQKGYIVSRDIMVGGFIRGDADNNLKIELDDAVFLLEYLFLGGPASEHLSAADSNDDDQLNLADAIKILSAVFLGSPLPQPYPEVGFDPTPGVLGN